jgi:hypothetical protein
MEMQHSLLKHIMDGLPCFWVKKYRKPREEHFTAACHTWSYVDVNVVDLISRMVTRKTCGGLMSLRCFQKQNKGGMFDGVQSEPKIKDG